MKLYYNRRIHSVLRCWTLGNQFCLKNQFREFWNWIKSKVVWFHLIFLWPNSENSVPKLHPHPQKENLSRHDCLRAPFYWVTPSRTREIMSYCMSELPSKFIIEAFDFHTKLNFTDLAKQNITSQQLYHWSAPIDLIEDYQQ